ncbi:MAG: hemagglutinin repeat-containing protein, partial [Gammaproteobacteria bacterium]
DRSKLLQLGTLYDNTLAFMAQSGLAFGEMPTNQQIQQLEAPVVVFDQQTLANNQVVYSPKLIVPQTGSDNNQLQAQLLFTQIIAYNELLLRGERVTNSASLVGGNRLIIETIDLTQTTTERNWYVDADGRVQYLSARIESPELVLSLSGDYVQEGGQIVSQGQVYLEAQTVEVRGVEIDGRAATAEIRTEDALIILAHERASYSHDVSLVSGGRTVLQAGSDLRFDGRLKAAGDIDLQAEGRIELTAVDIYASSETTGIYAGGNIFARAGGDFVNESNLKAGGDIAIAARDIINTRLSHKLDDATSVKNVSGAYKTQSITLTSGGRQILDTGKLDAGGDIFLIAERDIIDTAGRYYAGGDISLLAKRDISHNAISWQETEKLSEVYTRIRKRGKSDEEYTVTYRRDIGYNKYSKAVTGSLIALGAVNIQAGQDVNLFGTEIETGSNIALSGRDITLQAIETGSEQYRSIGRTITRSRKVRHQVAKLDAGGSIAIQAEGDLTTYGTQLKAGEDEYGNILINAKGEIQLRGVNNEDYSFYQHTRKKSFGRRKTWISEDRELVLEETRLSGGGSLLINLGVDTDGDLAGLESGKVVLEGATVNMGGDAMLYSADNLNILSGIEYEYHRREQHKRGAFGVNRSGSVSKEERQRLGHAEINTGGDTVLLSAGDINVVAGHLNAENIIAESGFGVEDAVARTTNINILGDRETLATFEHQYKRGLKFSIDDDFFSLAEEIHNKNWEIEQNFSGSVLNARNDIRLQTQGNIEILGSELEAGGDLALSANDISILAARDYYLEKEEKTISRIGIEIKSSGNSVDAFAGLETISITDEYSRDAVHGSVISAGNRIDIDASGSILQRSGELVAGSDIFLRAGDSIEVEVDHTIEIYNYEETTTRTGVSAGLTHNYGSTKAAVENIGQGDNDISNVSNVLQSIDAVDSFVSGPSVSGFAGVTTTTTRTQDTISTAQSAGVYSGGNIRFVADSSLNLTGTWVSAEDDINLSANDIIIRAAENISIQASTFRTSNIGLNLQANKNTGSVGLGGSYTEQDIDSVSGTIQASMLRSGESISLNAIRDLTVTASDLESGENLDLIAGRDVYLGAQSSTSDYQLDGRSGGAEYGFGYSTTSVGLYASVHVGEEDLLRRGTTYRNSELNVGQRLMIRSGVDTTLEGAIAEAEAVDLQIGGDLTLASLQDTGSADGSRYDASLRVMGGAGVSASGSVGEGSTEGAKAWVNQQTRLIGRDSVSATVAGHTQLDGAVLAADNGNLLLDTGTLGFSDIYDIEREKSDYLNIGFSLSGEQGSNPIQQQNNQATNLPLASGQQPDGSGGVGLTVSRFSSELDRAQINLATLGAGVVRVRQDEQTGNDSLANINRDVSISQQVTRDNSENTSFYLSDSSLNSLGGMFTLSGLDDNRAGKKNTFVRWTDDMGDYARSLYFTYRTMEELVKVESDNAVISAFSKAARINNDTVDFLGTWTLGLFPGVENNGGFYGE